MNVPRAWKRQLKKFWRKKGAFYGEQASRFQTSVGFETGLGERGLKSAFPFKFKGV
jgi:hypothetical protein